MKARELVRMARDAGAELVRHSGDHHIYRFPSGARVSIPMGGSQSEASPRLIAEVKRACSGQVSVHEAAQRQNRTGS